MIEYRADRRLYVLGGGLSVAQAMRPAAGGGGIGTTNLLAWWSLDETSGNRADSHSGGYTLTDTNTVLYGTGKQGNAADFDRASSEMLATYSATNLEFSDRDFTIAAWVYVDATDGDATIHGILGQNNTTTAGTRLNYYTGSSPGGYRVEFWMRYGGGRTINLTNNVPAPGNWMFVVAWNDTTANTMYVQCNNGTRGSVAYGTDSYTTANIGTYPFVLGQVNGPGTRYLNGLIDEACYWNRVLTADERTWLYNGGNGRTYSEL